MNGDYCPSPEIVKPAHRLTLAFVGNEHDLNLHPYDAPKNS